MYRAARSLTTGRNVDRRHETRDEEVKSLPTVSANRIAGKLIPRGIYRDFMLLHGFSLGTALDRRRRKRYLAPLFFLSLLAQFCAQGLAHGVVLLQPHAARKSNHLVRGIPREQIVVHSRDGGGRSLSGRASGARPARWNSRRRPQHLAPLRNRRCRRSIRTPFRPTPRRWRRLRCRRALRFTERPVRTHRRRFMVRRTTGRRRRFIRMACRSTTARLSSRLPTPGPKPCAFCKKCMSTKPSCPVSTAIGAWALTPSTLG